MKDLGKRYLTVTQKMENVANDLLDLDKEISRQKIIVSAGF